MTHVLDNPIWHALLTGTKHLSFGNASAKFVKRDVGFFAGLKSNSQAELEELSSLLPDQSLVVLFTTQEINIGEHWEIELNKELLQMVYVGPKTSEETTEGLISLDDQHIPAMLHLTSLTQPGPFLNRTLEFGNYEGIMKNGQLVAMSGQRLQPDPYTEISAVCTHPQFTGNGYAALLLRRQINKITKTSRIPFLHVYADNTGAVTLYQKLCFETRRQLLVYVLKKRR